MIAFLRIIVSGVLYLAFGIALAIAVGAVRDYFSYLKDREERPWE